ncbi:MAG TPA: sugar MFS transporter [Ginsengibacter sp.]|nr:sugar MFS transporter [Ginsengibacter sp.]
MLFQDHANQEESVKSGTEYRGALVSLCVLYLTMGFITSLNDTLVPFFKNKFSLSYSESSLVQFYFFLTYGLVSIPAGKMIERVGYKKGMVTGFLIAAMGAFLFLPAAFLQLYSVFLAALFVLAIGIVLLQVAANPYITLLGSPKTASSRLTFIQGLGSVGTTVAPVFGAYFLLSSKQNTSLSLKSVSYTYLVITILLVLVSLYVQRANLPVSGAKDKESKTLSSDRQAVKGLFSFRNLYFGVLAIFFYVGAEVSIGSYLTNYISDTVLTSERNANMYVAFYWGFMLIGRFLGALLLKKMKPSVLLSINAFAAIVLLSLSINSVGYFSIWSLIAVGFANSVMFAVIFSLSVNGVGSYAARASGLLSMAIVGGSLITFVMGIIKDNFSWQIAFIVPLVCYIYILFFGLSGYKPK